MDIINSIKVVLESVNIKGKFNKINTVGTGAGIGAVAGGSVPVLADIHGPEHPLKTVAHILQHAGNPMARYDFTHHMEPGKVAAGAAAGAALIGGGTHLVRKLSEKFKNRKQK